MRPLGWIGVVLLIVGAVAASGRLPFRTRTAEMQVGPMSVKSESRDYVPATFGIVAIVLGGALIFVGRKRS